MLYTSYFYRLINNTHIYYTHIYIYYASLIFLYLYIIRRYKKIKIGTASISSQFRLYTSYSFQLLSSRISALPTFHHPATIGSTYVTHKWETGMTSNIAGIMSAIGNSLTLIMRKPVASRSTPPHALKSLIMVGVQNG